MDGLNIQGANTPPAQRKTAAKYPSFLVDREPALKGFFRRVAEFLTERPVKVPNSTGSSPLVKQKFGADFRENLRELFKPIPRSLQGPVHSRLLLEWQPGTNVFLQNLRDLISPPKLPPLKVTSKPVQVRDIWSKNELHSRAQSLSMLVHVLGGLILIFPFIHSLSTPTRANETPLITVNLTDISPYLTKLPPGKDKAGGGGGGGERNPVPASKGRLPKFSLNVQLTPPVVKILNPNPLLAVTPTVVVPPDIRVPQPNLPNTGDPLSAMVTDSGGPGYGGGIGTGNGGGVGSGQGGGVGPGTGGGIGGGAFHAGRDGIGEPVCTYCPLAEFSEEARKAKHQGSVILRVIVQPDGRVTDISVVKGLGLGLDEKAMQAVRTWRLKPAMNPGGKPVAAWVDVEVVFRLL